MGKTKHKMLVSLEKNIEALAGEATSGKVMEGSEEITEKTDKKKLAEWTRDAVERLDALVDDETRAQIMESCGFNCAEVNKRIMERTRGRRLKSRSEDEFLEAEQRKPTAGTRLARKGNTLYQTYTPREFTRPMRCYCALFRGLPDNETVSATYCQCSKGFVKKFWETVLGKPVEVELVESALSGGTECKFAIHF